jgi:large subunit ribosomal protein L22
MKSFLKNYRQSPRKIGLVAGLIRGKKVNQALAILENTAKSAALPLVKMLKSATANAKAQGKGEAGLFIKELRVDKGVTLKRRMPRARGSAYLIRKRASHIALVLGDGAKVNNPERTIGEGKRQ